MATIILVFAFVFGAGGPGVDTKAMPLILDPLALVVTSILELVLLDFSLGHDSGKVNFLLHLLMWVLSLHFSHIYFKF